MNMCVCVQKQTLSCMTCFVVGLPPDALDPHHALSDRNLEGLWIRARAPGASRLK